MPALKVFSKFWHLSSDDVPLFASFGALFHCAWVVLIFISGRDILDMPQQCHHQGKQYIAVVCGLLLAFLSGFIIELLLIYEGCQGAVFELSARRHMPRLLILRFINLIVELVFTAYGTYVVFGTNLHCQISQTIVFSPKREIMILVILTWCFQVLTVLNAGIWYNMWPDDDMPEKWESRFMWIGRYICCQFRPYAAGEKEKSTTEYQKSLRRIARWVTKVIGKLDLTPSDSALALVLVATLQRRARKEWIARCLQEAMESGDALKAISLQERARSIRIAKVGGPRPANSGTVWVSPPDGGSPILVKAELTAGILDTEAHGKDSEVNMPDDEHHLSEAPGDQPTGPVQQTASGSISSTSPLENFRRQINLLQAACITPSGMDEGLRGDMPAEQATQIYTHAHWRVPADLLSEVDHFARFAVGVYGFDMEVLKKKNWWKTLKKAIKWDKLPRNRDAINRSKMEQLYQRLFYEGVEEELGQTSELLYVSVENQALSHLPYIIALDHNSKSVVVAVRGTWSMEDIITDSVAEPENVSNWLPKEFLEQHAEEADRFFAHGGIRAAADAVLEDLEANGILNALLRGDSQPNLDSPEQEVAERVASSSKSSGSKEEQKAQGHYVAMIMNRKLDCKGWRLVFTGHSLGAGAAALVALKLFSRFEGVQCWAFSPPGGLMSINLSRAVQPFVTSVAVGKDVVPRLSVVNIGRLIDQMVCALALCKHNKNRMLLRQMSAYWRHDRVDDLFWEDSKVPSEALAVLQAYSAGIESRRKMLELVPPGNLIFLRPIKAQGERVAWDAIWVKAEEIIREGVLISPNMANDHYAMTLQSALLAAQGSHDEEASLSRYFPPTYTEAGLAEAEPSVSPVAPA